MLGGLFVTHYSLCQCNAAVLNGAMASLCIQYYRFDFGHDNMIGYDSNSGFKGTWIQSEFLFLMERSIFYAKITVSQKKMFQKSVLNII